MNKLLVLIALLNVTIFSQTNISGGFVSGTWTKQNSPYLIDSTITIAADSSLIIESGVQIFFSNNNDLNVFGQLLAVGSENDSITFSPVDTTIGWGGIRFFNTNDNNLDSSIISFCSFKYGKAILGEDEHLSGGAIYIENSSRLEIGNSLFYRNIASGEAGFGGGAIYAKNSQILIHHCLFNQNKAVNNDGGAILANGCDVDIRHSDFINNHARSFGGAICTYATYYESSNYILKYLNITNNHSSSGGGIYLGKDDRNSTSRAILDFSLSTISDNSALFGGGIFSDLTYLGALPIRNVQFSSNSAYLGSAATFESYGYFQNCIFDHNFSTTDDENDGWTIHLDFGRAQFINCVLADNLDGRGVIGGYGGDGWDANIVNSLIWHNTSGISANNYYNDVDVVYSSVQYPWDQLDLGQGVKHINPEFRNRDERNYHVSRTSSVIDLGSPDAIFNDFAMDYNAGMGTRRNDMGAYGGKLNAWIDRPVANFIADNLHGKAPLEVHFTDLSLNNPLEFSWDFNNDGFIDSYEQNPTYIYEQPGVYSVKLIANSYELSDTVIFNEYVTVRSDTYNGEVSGIWDIDTVKINGNIYIPENLTLTIMPGTHVYFTGKFKFDIFGTLKAEGTETDSIFFFSDSLGYENWDYVGVWGGLFFHSTTENNQEQSTIKYCNFKYGIGSWMEELGNYVGGGIAFYKSNIEIENSKIDSCRSSFGWQQAVIFAHQSNVVIKNSLLSNSSNMHGVLIENGTLDFKSSISTKNEIGITSRNSTVNIDRSLLDSNGGNGFNSENSTNVIKDSEFSNNNYSPYGGQGGGMYVLNSPSTLLERVKVFNNYSFGEGAGLSFVGTNPILKNVEVAYNSADYAAGGIGISANGNGQIPVTATLSNCLIYKNVTRGSNSTGAGITMGANATINVINTTIANNTSTDFAAINNVWGTSVANVVNSIIYNNGNNYDIQVQGDNSTYNYSILQGFYAGMDTTTTNLNNYDPVFINASEDNFHLQNISCGGFINSPAIDSGSPLISDLILDCDAGLGTSISDMGTFGGSSNRWNNDILPECFFVGEVSGTWNCEEVIVEGDIFVSANDTLTINPGTKITFLNSAKFDVFGTLIAVGNEEDSIIFTSIEATWSGIRFYDTDTTEVGTSFIDYCVFENSNVFADEEGKNKGGALSINYVSNLKVLHSIFRNNRAYLGGAIYINNASPRIEYNVFEQNFATAGGAIYLESSEPTLHRLDFLRNTATDGAAMFFSYSSPQVTNVLAINNISTGNAGFAFLFNSSPYIINLTASGNTSPNGGSFSLMYDSNPDLLNSILWGNSQPDIYFNDGAFSAEYSIIENGWDDSFFGEGCLDEDPLFRNTQENDYHLSAISCGSVWDSQAIDAGTPNLVFRDTHLDCGSGLGFERSDMGNYGGAYFEEEVGIEGQIYNSIPKKHSLFQNYPNPFNPSTRINYSIPVNSNVVLKIYNILGKEIATLVNGQKVAGNYTITFDASKLASGVYFYKLQSGSFSETKKMVILK